MERYPNLKEEVGGLNPSCKISSTKNLLAFCLKNKNKIHRFFYYLPAGLRLYITFILSADNLTPYFFPRVQLVSRMLKILLVSLDEMGKALMLSATVVHLTLLRC